MKKFTIGFIAGVLSFLLVGDLVRIASDHSSKLHNIDLYFFEPGLGLWLPLTGRCTKELRHPPGGQVQVRREYFQCNLIQNKLSDIIYRK